MIIYFLLTGAVSFLAGVLLMDYLHKKVDKAANNYIVELKRQLNFFKDITGPSQIVNAVFKNKALKN